MSQRFHLPKNVSPTNKVTAAAGSAPLAILISWLLELAGLNVPTDVAISIAALCAFGCAWLVNERPVVR